MSVTKVLLLGCAQDGGIPQMGCSCPQCRHGHAASGDFKDGMVVCLGIVDEAEGQVFMVDATPDFGRQLWALQHSGTRGYDDRPLQLGGILLTHAHTGHYAGLLQLGKEGGDTTQVPVFCTPSMSSFLQNNEPWAQLSRRGNISIRELDLCATGEAHSIPSVQLTPNVSFVPVPVPHRAEFSDTVAYAITLGDTSSTALHDVSTPPSENVIRGDTAAVPTPTGKNDDGSQDTLAVDGATMCSVGGATERERLRLLYCPDTDTWSEWKRSIRDWCQDVDLALLDATFYDDGELPGRDMSEVPHPLARESMRILAGCSAEVVLIHFNHTNPLISADSAQRAEAIAAGFKVGAFGMEWGVSPRRHSTIDAGERETAREGALLTVKRRVRVDANFK